MTFIVTVSGDSVSDLNVANAEIVNQAAATLKVSAKTISIVAEAQG